VLEAGMCFAVEPMVNLGTKDTDELEDGWTVITMTAGPRRTSSTPSP
jgi:methionyl aminopeptidase